MRECSAQQADEKQLKKTTKSTWKLDNKSILYKSVISLHSPRHTLEKFKFNNLIMFETAESFLVCLIALKR